MSIHEKFRGAEAEAQLGTSHHLLMLNLGFENQLHLGKQW